MDLGYSSYRYLGNVLLSVFILLTSAAGGKVWVKKSEIVAIMRVQGVDNTHVLTASGKVYVTESPETILKELEDEHK